MRGDSNRIASRLLAHPGTTDPETFASLITELATRFDAPVFEPHVTTVAVEEPAEVIETALAYFEPLPLFIMGVVQRKGDVFAISSYEDVEAWRVAAERRLTG